LTKQKGEELQQLAQAIANNGNKPDWLRDLQAMQLTLMGFNSGTSSTGFILDQAEILASYVSPDGLRRDTLIVGFDFLHNRDPIVLRSE
jgi:hypothetical protein